MKPAYEVNGKPVDRAGFYALACDPARSVAVEACAGAGKTWMLVSRIVRALLEGVPPQDILAITFTRKAAGEMRQRLAEWLSEFASADAPRLQDELISRGMGAKPASDRVEMLRTLQQKVLEAGRPVPIRTFHSWFAALLGTAPLSVLTALGFPARYTLLEDDSEAVALVWRRFFARLTADEAAQADYRALVAVHGRSQASAALAAALQRRVEFSLADATGVVENSVPSFEGIFPALAGLDDPQAWLQDEPQARPLLLAAASALGSASQVSYSAKGRELETALSAGDWAGVVTALLTQKGDPRKFSDKLAGIDAVREAQAAVQQVLQADAQHQAWLHQQRMTRLTRLLVAEFSALKREHGWIDMNDVERGAQIMLADPLLSGWVQQRLDARVRHLLIDEFQDTSPLQWQALHAWLQSYVGAGGGALAPSVFIVGDPKQSIYRFRRAEPQVFRAAQAFVRDGLGGDLLSCDHTRRNAPAVIDTVNAVMTRAQEVGAYAGFRAHSTESAAAGQVLALPQIPRDGQANPESAGESGEGSEGDGEGVLRWRDSLTTPQVLPQDSLRVLECRQAAAWLAGRIADGLPPQSVMVLSRRRDRLSLMQDALRNLHIATEQPEKTDLTDAPEVLDLIALIDVLVSPGHDLSLARALKSPLFGLADDDLVQLALLRRTARAAVVADASPSWLDVLLTTPSLPPPLAQAAVNLRRYKGWVDILPPHDALDAIYHHGDVLARFAAAVPAAARSQVLTRLRALLSASLALEGGRFLTPYALVRAFRKGGIKAPAGAQSQAVRLLTIHGAKGLEADLVLLLDADAEPPKSRTMDVLVDWPGELPAPRQLVFLASESRPPASAADLLAAELVERAREELNGLYVAMTRARTQLVVSSSEPFRGSDGTAWKRLLPLAQPVPAGPAPQPDGDGTAAGQGGTAALEPLFMPFLAKPSVKSSFDAPDSGFSGDSSGPTPATDSDASRIGQAMHALLESLQGAPPPGAGEPFAADALARVSRDFALTTEMASTAAAMATRILRGEGAWCWDAALLDWQGNEVTVMHQGQTLRIDRLVRRRLAGEAGEWWVLDFKSAARPGEQAALLEQLRRYRTAVQAANPGEPVRGALLGSDGRLVEVSG